MDKRYKRHNDSNQVMLKSIKRDLELIVKQNQELLRENTKLKEFIMKHCAITQNNCATVNPNGGDDRIEDVIAVNYDKITNESRIKDLRYKMFEQNIALMSLLVTVGCFLLDSMDSDIRSEVFFGFIILIVAIIYVRLKNSLKQYPLH